MDSPPRRFFLSQGFLGTPIALRDPRSSRSFGPAEARSHGIFKVLAAFEEGLAEGEILAGFLSYECAAALEPKLELPPAPLAIPAAAFSVFTRAERLSPQDLAPPDHCPAPLSAQEGDTPSVYGAQVENIRERITAGDLFQVNYSHRQTAYFSKTEKRLLDRLPWPDALQASYGALIDFGDASIISASPELFLSLDGRRLATEPIKGTRPRGSNPTQDQALLQDLKDDPKDRAENIMIADLMRNDLAKVCADHSVREVALAQARTYPAVHHLFSRVEGDLKPASSFTDAIAAAFPCGSVTGAPKMAAMDAIAELEGEGRGAYCGSIFAITKKRSCASVAIRTAIIDEAAVRLDVRSGGGVTILSDPEAEYKEAIDKGYLFRLLTGRDDPRH